RHSPFIAFCTDDRNPLDIAEEGHLDFVIRTAIKLGAPPLAAYRAASWSAAKAFRLHDRGLVAPGWRADLVVLDDLAECRVAQVIAAGRAGILAKIEKPQAFSCLPEIIDASDAIMVARGDLGVEMPIAKVPGLQKQLIRACRKAGKPVVVATQMLESMIT
ncbi:amidohydrolase family protein, partial [Mycobacterium tuberculosis]|nr:amidohydrolase family protein [Mycobacterium tuberculosis]